MEVWGVGIEGNWNSVDENRVIGGIVVILG